MVQGYLLRLLLIMLAGLPLYLILRQPWHRTLGRELALGLFVLFMVGLLFLTLQGTYTQPREMLELARYRLIHRKTEGVNLIPFATVRSILKYGSRDQIMINLVANVLMFVPWGFGLPLLWRRFQSLPALLAASLALTVFIESVQLFIARSVDVDDLILNFTGGCLGGMIYFLLRRFVPSCRNLSK